METDELLSDLVCEAPSRPGSLSAASVTAAPIATAPDILQYQGISAPGPAKTAPPTITPKHNPPRIQCKKNQIRAPS
jgi:hypothetical protein